MKSAFGILVLCVAAASLSAAMPSARELHEECLHPVVLCPAQDPPTPVYYADPMDCRSFYECSNGKPFHFTCPADLVFDPVLNVCNFGSCKNDEGSGTGPSISQ